MFAWFILFLLGAIWGASFLFIKVGVAEIPPFTFVLGRTLIAATVLFGVMRFRREAFPRTRALWTTFIALGILNGVIPYTLITWGETHITSGLASILNAAMPLFTVLLAHYWTHDERMTMPKMLGVLVGFVGVVIVFLPELRGGIQIEFWGQLAVVGAALSYAVATIMARRTLRGVSPVLAAAGQLGTAAMWMVIPSIVIDRPWTLRPTLPALGALVTLAILGTAVAYILYYWLVNHTGATRTSLVTYLLPIFGVMWGAVLLREPIAWEAILGLSLILAGVILVNRKFAPQTKIVGAMVESSD
ncbi:MAG: EamA family transporter [Chloroflexi bacterium]|nr:EamA family transporter [Chloroflexota bacterium]